MPDPDLEAGIAFYRRGFALMLDPPPRREQVKRWLAEEKRVEKKYEGRIAPIIAAAVARWEATTLSCPWCGGQRHDTEGF